MVISTIIQFICTKKEAILQVANSSKIFDTLNGGCKTHQLVKLYELDKALWKKVFEKAKL